METAGALDAPGRPAHNPGMALPSRYDRERVARLCTEFADSHSDGAPVRLSEVLALFRELAVAGHPYHLRVPPEAVVRGRARYLRKAMAMEIPVVQAREWAAFHLRDLWTAGLHAEAAIFAREVIGLRPRGGDDDGALAAVLAVLSRPHLWRLPDDLLVDVLRRDAANLDRRWRSPSRSHVSRLSP